MFGVLKRLFPKPNPVSPSRKYLERFHLNLKCSHCNRFTNEITPENPPIIFSYGHPMAVGYLCPGCINVNHLVCEAGFWFDAEQFGISIAECEATLNQYMEKYRGKDQEKEEGHRGCTSEKEKEEGEDHW